MIGGHGVPDTVAQAASVCRCTEGRCANDGTPISNVLIGHPCTGHRCTADPCAGYRLANKWWKLNHRNPMVWTPVHWRSHASVSKDRRRCAVFYCAGHLCAGCQKGRHRCTGYQYTRCQCIRRVWIYKNYSALSFLASLFGCHICDFKQMFNHHIRCCQIFLSNLTFRIK